MKKIYFVLIVAAIIIAACKPKTQTVDTAAAKVAVQTKFVVLNLIQFHGMIRHSNGKINDSSDTCETRNTSLHCFKSTLK